MREGVPDGYEGVFGMTRLHERGEDVILVMTSDGDGPASAFSSFSSGKIPVGSENAGY